MTTNSDHPAVKRFQEYIRIKTVHPTPAYKECSEWLLKQAADIGIPAKVFEPVDGKPFVIMTIEGKQPKLASLMLFPVFPDQWICDPFAAEIIDGKIMGRGTQDMKCVGSAYLEALRVLTKEGWKPERTVHVVWGPDEEIGGEDGVRHWVDMDNFKSLGVGFVLDEGIASTGNNIRVFHAERSPWWIWIKATGNVGHGSQFIQDPAPAKLLKVLNKFLQWRDTQEALFKFGMKSDGSRKPLTLGDVTTVNLTMLKCGIQMNVLPNEAFGGLDVRVSPWVNLVEFENMIKGWCEEESGVTYSFQQKFDSTQVTAVDDTNPWFVALREVAEDHKIEITPEVFPAASDSRFIRKLNIPALGISYLRNVEPLLHHHNEYVPVDTFLESIGFYTDLIRKLSNL
ncbi:adenylate cyclase [Phlyctochytrium planicorne]|nr:adenylate cyclase [Phlyctochytrium planicorne]